MTSQDLTIWFGLGYLIRQTGKIPSTKTINFFMSLTISYRRIKNWANLYRQMLYYTYLQEINVE